MSTLRPFGRMVRRAIALCILAVVRGRRVLVPIAALLLVGLVVLGYARPSGAPAAARSTPARPAAASAGSGAAPAAAVGGPAVSSTSPEVAIQQVIERGDQAQVQALASGDPSPMRGLSSDAYYQEVVRTNQSLKGNGVTAIRLDNLEWGPITVTGDVATATVYETWTTEFANGPTVQSRDRNVYGLVRQNGAWQILSDQHPDAAAAGQPAGTGALNDPGGLTQPGPAQTGPGQAPARTGPAQAPGQTGPVPAPARPSRGG